MRKKRPSERVDANVPEVAELLKIGQAAAILSVRPGTISSWIHFGLLHPVHLGRLVRLRRREVYAIANGQKPFPGNRRKGPRRQASGPDVPPEPLVEGQTEGETVGSPSVQIAETEAPPQC